MQRLDPIKDLYLPGACNHGRAVEYYIESILLFNQSDTFLSSACDSWDDYRNAKCKKAFGQTQMGDNLA